MLWDKDYKKSGRIWGENPGVLAIEAVRYLKKNKLDKKNHNILDIGCGYGRDVFYLSYNTSCNILGIDVSKKAIEIAMDTVLKTGKGNIRFQCRDFTSLKEENYDIIFASNVYQILNPPAREALKNTVKETLKPGGLLFLATLSTRDPEHYGKGMQVAGESNSFKDEKYIHFCTREELIKDFGFLNIKELYEQEYNEPRSTGETHHHISWILIGSQS